VFENVCRFDEAAAFAGSSLTDCRNDQVTAARTTVQFVADIIVMKERLTVSRHHPRNVSGTLDGRAAPERVAALSVSGS